MKPPLEYPNAYVRSIVAKVFASSTSPLRYATSSGLVSIPLQQRPVAFQNRLPSSGVPSAWIRANPFGVHAAGDPEKASNIEAYPE